MSNEQILKEEMTQFVWSTEHVFTGMFGKSATLCMRPAQIPALVLEEEFTFSILFLGSVFGEFILSMPKSTAHYLAHASLGEGEITDADIRDTFSECLNMVAGARLKTLTKTFPKLTITAPRTTSGVIRYPGVRAMQAVLEFDGHPVRLSFYLDEMRLDIAESYKSSLKQLQLANQDLLHANEKLKLQQMQLVHSEKMASLGTMAAGVAHEINNPLSFVLSNTEVLGSYMNAFQELFGAYQRLLTCITEKRTKDAKEELSKVQSLQQEKDIPYILEDTSNLMAESKSGLDRIRGIVNGLKLFSRVDDSGGKKVQVNDELRNTLQLIANELKYRCKVDFSPGEIPEIECIPGELGQVFVNLLVNASQAMPTEGGQLRIRTLGSGNGINVEVSDNGCGIPKENIGKIFDPFFTTKPVGQGTGLGLAISHSIVLKHGGEISVESTPGIGTTFVVHLPLKMAEAKPEKDWEVV